MNKWEGCLIAWQGWNRLLSIAAIALIAWWYPGLVEAEFTLTQLTNTSEGSNGGPAISADGSRIAFTSSADLVPDGNPDGNSEIFRWTSPSTIIQLTNTVPILGGGMEDSTISADGTRIAFATNHDLTGDNPDGNEEIFLWTSPSTITQLTKSIGAAINAPAISADGSRVVFASNHDLTGDNPDGNSEIFLWNSGGTTQLTDTTEGNSYEPAISADGRRIAFTSWSNLTGSNSDGNEEIFLWTGPSTITQLTATIATTGSNNFSPSISADGVRIAFISTADLIPNGNPDGNGEIFLWTDGFPITQISTTTGGFNLAPAISADGTRIAFHSDRNLVQGNNADGNFEIFLWTGPSTITQLTATIATTGSNNFSPSISADGVRIAFISTADLIPNGNPDGNFEIFLLQEYHTLTITIAGTGTVTGPGIICPGDCTKAFLAGSPVALNATAAPGLIFSGFSGDADCTNGTLTMNADTHCIATFAPAGADLTGTWSSASQNWSKGRYTLRGTVRVVNQGTTTASASRLRIFLSDDAVLDPGDTLLREFKIKKRKSGQGKTKKLKVTLPVGVSAAGKYLFAVVDALHSVTEANETNNTPMTGPIP